MGECVKLPGGKQPESGMGSSGTVRPTITRAPNSTGRSSFFSPRSDMCVCVCVVTPSLSPEP